MISTLLAFLAISTARVEPSERRIGDFALTDTNGRTCHLSDWRERRLVVLVFLGVECPLAKLYTPRLNELARRFEPHGVEFVGIDSNQHDASDELAQFATEHHLAFPLFIDAARLAAEALGAERTPEAFLLDRDRVVRYRGRIDDQYGVGTRRDGPRRNDLAEAIEELLADRPVSVPATEARGCHIGRRQERNTRSKLTYSGDVAPILARHCVACHQPGQIGPFPLLSYGDAIGWTATIREAVAERRMPPWHASPDTGEFRNAPTFSDAERRTLLAWIDEGAAEGNAAEQSPPLVHPDGWTLGTPGQIVGLAEPYAVPAEGLVDYLWFEFDPGFGENRFVVSAEVRPGNRRVVHHCTVFIGPPGRRYGEVGNVYFSDFTPGREPLDLPPGMARLVPAGWHVYFSLHYITVGSPQTDQTVLGLRFADPATVRKEVVTTVISDPDLRIPPHAADYRTERTLRVPDDWLLLSMFPHMHLRGKSFRYEATYPDGSTEVLLDVPRYDFNWQHQYALIKPKRLPAGTRLRCTGHYDNSDANPHNPDPSMTVITGPRSTDEMFHGYFDIALADQDRLSLWSRLSDACPRVARAVMLLAVVVVGWRLRRRRHL